MLRLLSSAGVGPAALILILLRALAGLALLYGFSQAADGAIGVFAARPSFADLDAQWPAFQALGVLLVGGGAAVKAAPVVLAIGFAIKLFADGAASWWYARVEEGEANGFPKALFREGWGRMLAMARVALVTASMLVGGAVVIAGVFTALAAEASPQTLQAGFDQGLHLAAAIVLWGAVVGAIGTWTRAELGARNGKSVRIALPLGVSGLARRPFAGLVFYMLAALAPTALGAALLVCLRASEPTTITPGLMSGVGAGIILAQAFFWHWTLRYATFTRVQQKA